MARMERFRFEKPRQQFIASRGMLRAVLAGYVDQAAEEITLTFGKRGKPGLVEGELQFNLTHSEDVLLLGITKGRRIGVDVEFVHPLEDMLMMARQNFSAYEQHVLFTLPEDQQEQAFFNCWTRKEAYIKATGDGFSMPLRNFDVTMIPGEAARMLRAEGVDPERWTLHHLEPYTGYVGAICVEGAVASIEQIEFKG